MPRDLTSKQLASVLFAATAICCALVLLAAAAVLWAFGSILP